MVFEKKLLSTPKRVCYRLKEARESAGISLEELAQRTRLNRRHLQALEECRFDAIPYARIYQKNFVKSYTHALGLQPESFVQQFSEEEMQPSATDMPVVSSRKYRRYLSNVPYLIRNIGIACGTLLFILYLGMQVRSIVEPPILTLISPDDGSVVTSDALTVRGKTDYQAIVSINGQPIHTNGNGEFSQNITLSSGINTIMISSKKRYGKEVSEVRRVILRDGPQFSLNR